MTAGTWWMAMGLGVGLTLVTVWASERGTSLDRRLAPYVQNTSDGLRLGDARVRSSAVVVAAIAAAVQRRLEGVGMRRADLERRLARARAPLSVEQFRIEQVAWAVGGLCVGALMGGLASGATMSSKSGVVVLVLLCAAVGAVTRDYVLQRAIRRHESRVLAELPVVADMLALSVTAGEGVLGAIERISRRGNGALAMEMREVLARSRAGAPLPMALRDLACVTGVSALRRFCEAVAAAVERGTPLAAVLHAQAVDVRDHSRRTLMEDGGKREIAMMVPVIFLILPVTVVFAVFPGVVAIRLGL